MRLGRAESEYTAKETLLTEVIGGYENSHLSGG
jgi:hypothetical protein